MTAPAAPVASVPARPRRRWGRNVAVALGAGVLVAALIWTPTLLRQLEFFRVHRVEVRGTKLIIPDEIVARLAIDTTFSIWSDLDSLESRVAAHPQVRSVSVSRDLPGTLVVSVQEVEPVAFVPTPTGLKAHDASGKVLPFDPSRVGVDLPIVSRRDTALLRLLAEIREADPEFFRRISEVRRVGRREIAIQLMTITVRAMDDISVERFAELSSVESDLARRRAHARELDLRFKDQVIARLP
jgi:cell division protein FtsQ